MIDFPLAELLDDSICLIWLKRHLHRWVHMPPLWQPKMASIP